MIFKDALNGADIGVVQFRQILNLIQTVNNLVDRRTVGTHETAAICHTSRNAA